MTAPATKTVRSDGDKQSGANVRRGAIRDLENKGLDPDIPEGVGGVDLDPVRAVRQSRHHQLHPMGCPLSYLQFPEGLVSSSFIWGLVWPGSLSGLAARKTGGG